MLQHDWKKLEKESILREKVSQSSCNVSKLPKNSSDDSKIGKGAESCTSTVIKNDDSSPSDANSILNDMKDSLHITSPSRNDEHVSADDNQTGDSDSDKDAFNKYILENRIPENIYLEIIRGQRTAVGPTGPKEP